MPLKINYDEILDTALKGVRRTVAFMGLGVNAALDPEFRKYSLTNITQIQLLPMNLDTEQIDDIKNHFLTWVVGCGLRELIETFGVFLDQIFVASMHIAVAHKNYNSDKAEKEYCRFQYRGIEYKLDLLRDTFGIAPEYPSYIVSINQARNCLTHRRGMVEQRDCDNGKSLVIKWLGLDLIALTQYGEDIVEILLDLTSREYPYFENEADICLRYVERELNFPLGHLVEISAKYLAEICFFMIGQAKSTHRSALDYAREAGVKIYDLSKMGSTT